MKFYAVKVGRKTGIFETWGECEKSIVNFVAPVYRSFNTRKEAEDYLDPTPMTEEIMILSAPSKYPEKPLGYTCSQGSQENRHSNVILPAKRDRSPPALRIPVRRPRKRREAEDPNFKYEGSYSLFFDGVSKGDPGESGSGFLIKDWEGNVIDKGCIYNGIAGQNESEYKGLILGMNRALDSGIKSIKVYGDTKLVMEQIMDKQKVKNDALKNFHSEVKALIPQFSSCELTFILRSGNREADRLANFAIEVKTDSLRP